MYQARKLHARTGCGQPKLDLVYSFSHPGWAPQQRTDASQQWTLLEQSNTCTTFYWEYLNVHLSPFCKFNQGNTSRTFSHKRGFHSFPPGQTFYILQLREKYTINQILHRVVAVDASLSSQLKCSILHLEILPPGKIFTSSCFSFFLRLATCCQDSSTSSASLVKDGL